MPVELSAAARHPYMQRKHVAMLTGQNLVTDFDDQLVALVIEPLASMVRICRSFFKNCIRGNHLARNEVLPTPDTGPWRAHGLYRSRRQRLLRAARIRPRYREHPRLRRLGRDLRLLRRP